MMKYQLKYIKATISVEEYIRDYRDVEKFMVYCKQCHCYAACWACPPFDFDVTGRLMQYENVHIIGTKIVLDDTLLNKCTGERQCNEASYQVIGEVRRELDDKLLALERQYPDSLAFFAGTCLLCGRGKCTRIDGKPCLHPAFIRPSLEAFGFDISKTTSQLLNTDLKWGSRERLPEYFVLVGGFFTDRRDILPTFETTSCASTFPSLLPFRTILNFYSNCVAFGTEAKRHINQFFV